MDRACQLHGKSLLLQQEAGQVAVGEAQEPGQEVSWSASLLGGSRVKGTIREEAVIFPWGLASAPRSIFQAHCLKCVHVCVGGGGGEGGGHSFFPR